MDSHRNLKGKKTVLVAYTFNRSDLGGLEGFLRIQLVSNNNNNNNNRVGHGVSHCNPSTWERLGSQGQPRLRSMFESTLDCLMKKDT